MNAILTRHFVAGAPRWALDGKLLAPGLTLAQVLAGKAADLPARLRDSTTSEPAPERLLAPVDPGHEVWACGVTYLRSRTAREAESTVKDIYTRVYDADRPESFFKASGWRVVNPGAPVRIRRDSRWNVPEPELTLVVTSRGEIVGYTAGNDMSSRDIEGDNPLYLPQAKVYDGSCALGPGIVLADEAALRELPIGISIRRGGAVVFEGTTSSQQMKRTPAELVSWLTRELSFPDGVFIMTGTGIIPPDAFTLERGDLVRISVGPLVLENPVA